MALFEILGAERRAGAAARRRRGLRAPQLLVLSFAGAIAVGALGLALLPGLQRGPRLGAIDALFQATSAVCVTGLSVADLGATLTPLGQVWMLLLIQAGGLGMLTFAALVASAVSGRASLAVEEAAAGPAALLPAGGAASLVRVVVASSAAVELAGAAALFALWAPRFGPGDAAWLALFHSVSAFCNAGFSLFSDSLVGFREDPATLLVVSALLVAGGLGFLVFQDLRLRAAGRRRRLSLHTRLALGTTAALLAASSLLFLAFEAGGALAGLGPADRLANAFFLAATPRTAGFQTLDYDAVSNRSLFLTIGLMWIGGSAGSTAGGIKTTTFALLVLLLAARLRGERSVSAGGRTVPAETIQRSVGLAVFSLLLLGAVVFGLLVSEAGVEGGPADRGQLARLVFEAQSALGTVGLSMGVTSTLTPGGRLLVCAAMFAGRVGPLALLGAMALRSQRATAVRFAHEDVLVG